MRGNCITIKTPITHFLHGDGPDEGQMTTGNSPDKGQKGFRPLGGRSCDSELQDQTFQRRLQRRRSAALDQELKSQVILGTRGASIQCGLAFTEEEAFLISAFSSVNHGDGRRGNDGSEALGEPPDYLWGSKLRLSLTWTRGVDAPPARSADQGSNRKFEAQVRAWKLQLWGGAPPGSTHTRGRGHETSELLPENPGQNPGA